MCCDMLNGIIYIYIPYVPNYIQLASHIVYNGLAVTSVQKTKVCNAKVFVVLISGL